MEYNTPNDWTELFSEPEQRYHIHDPEYAGDNVFAMRLFLEAVDAPADAVALDDGTQVFLRHKDYPYQIRIDSSGDGDMHLHGYDITRVYGGDRVFFAQEQTP